MFFFPFRWLYSLTLAQASIWPRVVDQMDMLMAAKKQRERERERERAREHERKRKRDRFLSFLFSTKSDDKLSFFFVSMADAAANDAAINAAALAASSQRVVVLDNGGCSIKLGFAGDAHPM